MTHDLWLSLMLRHGDRVPPEDAVAIDTESYPHVDRLLADIAVDFPDVRILSVIAAAGRLHVNYALPTNGDHDFVRHALFDECCDGTRRSKTMMMTHDPDFPRIKLDDLQADFAGVFDGARYVDVGIGWLPLVRAFVHEALPHDPSLEVREIKEKWGSMRIWCDTPVLAARLAKGKAEIKSALVCEVCGEPGHVRRPPPNRMAWWRCRCDDHSSEDQRSWPRREPGELVGTIQVRDQWYRYDEAADAMIEIDTPERFR